MAGSSTANYVNHFFANIGPKLAGKFINERKYSDSSLPEFELSDIYTDFEEVHDICKEINTAKYSAIDLLSSKILKDAFLVLTVRLVYLFNLSLSSHIFPPKWKQATVIPLYKGGSRSEVGNYQPISLLPLPGKLLERVVHNKLSSYLETNNLLCDEQNGSTVKSIVNLTDALLSAINNNETCLAVFIDLKKAFDTVDHQILIKKLSNLGVGGDVLLWVSNYLHDRSQKTIANHILSSPLPVSCGVPQGSILGPLFFVAYINDVYKFLNTPNLGLYADDTVIFLHSTDRLVAQEELQSKLNLFANWCEINVLTINTQKTKYMAIGTRSKVKKAKNSHLAINDVPIQQVPSYKYLGFTLDSVLSYSNHGILSHQNI